MEELRIIISGGGTGGHIFPALSIANAIRQLQPHAQILFVGAEGRMEMQRVPDAGYKIVGLPVSGFDRKKLWRNLGVLVKLVRSQWKARSIIRSFAPQVVVGVGGYASGPTLKMAQLMGIPTLIQEQNSYAGVTNKLLAQKAQRICVAYQGMEHFFPQAKIQMTGNPVRQTLLDPTMNREKAHRLFSLNPALKTVLILGGSLGARTLNEAVLAHLPLIHTCQEEVQFIWQTGKGYIGQAREALREETVTKGALPNITATDFIKEMGAAYAAADLVVSRAGAGSISEFCLLHKPVILIPSPNVAEDHQTKNALALVEKQAAFYIIDKEANEKLVPTAIALVKNEEQLKSLSQNIATLALPDSATIIAKEVIKLATQHP